MNEAEEAAAFWGSAENQHYPLADRLACALKALEFYGGLAVAAEEAAEAAGSEGESPDAVAALQSVVDYCRFSERLAGEGVIPEAVGLARAYKDIADRLDERLARSPSPTGGDARLLSRLLFESRERVEMARDMVEHRSGKTDDWARRLVGEIDAYRARRGWSPHGFGGEL